MGPSRLPHSWWCSSLAGSLEFSLPLPLGFTSITILLRQFLLPLHLSILAWQHTCMSGGSYNDDIAEITVRFRGLVVSVSGPAAQASSLVEDLARLSRRGRSPSPTQSLGSFSAVSSVPETAPPATRRGETREEIAQSFAQCPQRLLSQASRLGGDLDYSQGRIRRAWVAGQWAGAVLSNRVGSPNRTEQIREGPRVYVVLRAEGLQAPRCFGTSAAYWDCIGSLRNSSSISHSFPSETEARAYCEGAGIPYPGR